MIDIIELLKITLFGHTIGNCPLKTAINIYIRILALASIVIKSTRAIRGFMHCDHSEHTNLNDFYDFDCINNHLLFSNLTARKMARIIENDFLKENCRLKPALLHEEFSYLIYFDEVLLVFLGTNIFLDAILFTSLTRFIKKYLRVISEKYDNFEQRKSAMSQICKQILSSTSNENKPLSLLSWNFYFAYIIVNMVIHIVYLSVLLFGFQYNVSNNQENISERFSTYFGRPYEDNFPILSYCEVSYCSRTGSVRVRDVLCHIKHNLIIRIFFPVLLLSTVLVVVVEFVYLVYFTYLLQDKKCDVKNCQQCIDIHIEHRFSKFKLLEYVNYPLLQLFQDRPWIIKEFSRSDILLLMIFSRECKNALSFQCFFDEYLDYKLSGCP